MNDNPTFGDKQGDITPSGTPTDNIVPGTDSDTSSDQTLKPETDTEATTTAISGSGDDTPSQLGTRAAQRIGELIKQNKSLRAQLEGTDESAPAPTYQAPQPNAPELQRAKDFLKDLGFSPTSEIKATMKDEIQNMEARMILDGEKMRLESIYNGQDGRPKYDHEKVLKHARETGIYNPEVAYEHLYKAELMDWTIKNAQKTSNTFVEKPTSSATPETGQLTRESLARILSTPDGRKWYDQNRDKVLSALTRGEL